MTSKSFHVHAAAVCLVVVATASGARSQGYPFSQRGTVTQNVAFTEIAVSYGRPVARGRALFGALDYLTGYPYGCTEQTMSRFLPTVIVAAQEALRAVPVFREAWNPR